MKPLCVLLLCIVPLALRAQDIPLSKIVVEKEDWKEVAGNLENITFLDAHREGDLHIYRRFLMNGINAKGEVYEIPPPPGQPRKMERGSVGSRAGRIYAIAGNEVLAHGESSAQKLQLRGLTNPQTLALWPDHGHLVIGESDGAYLWAVRIEKDGSFGPGDRYYSLRTVPGEKLPVTGIVMDAGYLLYACTPLGIQVFDPTGRLSAVLRAPSKEPMISLAIGGPTADTLFVAAGNKIYARKIQGKAAYTLQGK